MIVVTGATGNVGTPLVRVSPDIERVLGRAPRAFAGWAARNVDAFR
ncbi:nucleoside-diphosphate-sugar epimerase [Crossiella equi]|uniref:Nucleoside-diphosphate-sugar epimerase n=1 Tax=Crossiella equi TaxID=130796 RepID=A0ABS5ASW7_9PSEU|nr:hypothetical protein [Crossiella equi]MBP2479289.1 nucleoside-diphosphate-sugar epimerase [Crossiella equi]